MTLLIASTSATTQNVRFEHLTVQDGLSQDIITAIAQDEQGFLWFGTEDGLNRFDGYTVTVFKHNLRDSTSLRANDIVSIFPDFKGHVWIGTSSGPDMFDLRTQTFRHRPLPSGVSKPSTTSFCITADSSLWAGTEGGLLRLSGTSFHFVTVNGHPLTQNIRALSIEASRVWYVDSVGLHYCKVLGERLEPMQLPRVMAVLRHEVVSQVMRDRKRALWVSTWSDGIYRFDSAFVSVTHYGADARNPSAIRDRAVRAEIEDRDGTLWFGTATGLERYEPSLDGFLHIRCEPLATVGAGLLGSRVYSLCVDRTGILWVGTYRGGVNSYARSRLKFRVYSPSPDSASHDILAINESPHGELLVGTMDGLYAVNDTRPEAMWTRRREAEHVPVNVITRCRNNEVWIGTEHAIGLLGDNNRKARRIALPVDDAVRCIFEDSDRTLWVGTEQKGLFTYDRLTAQFVRWSPPNGVLANGVWSMFSDHQERIWIGTWQADYLFRVDKRDAGVRRFGFGPLRDVFIENPAVRAFREDRAGTLWFATWGAGLYHLDSSDVPIQHFTEFDGLPSDFLKSLELDRRGRLWIGTERGLSCLDPSTGMIKTYTQIDGLPSNFFYSGASYERSDGMLFFGGENGFVVFDPDSLPVNRVPPQVVITGFRIFDKPIQHSLWVGNPGGYTLRYDQDFFSFDFVALDFAAPRRNRFAYKLEGFDRDWIQAGSRHYASYTSLDPGKYVFRVKAANNDGVWNDAGASLAIEITPPYWSEWWFRLSAAALVLFAVTLAYRYRIRRMVEVELLRNRIARDLHDDIGTNLSAMVLASRLAGRDEIPAHLRDFFESIRTLAIETQDQMRTIVWMLNPRNDPPEMLISRMKDEAARVLRGISYAFHEPGGSLPGSVGLEMKRHFFLIYKEALHNIARHAHAGTVTIALAFADRTLDLHLIDDGIGFDPAASQEGNGIGNMKERARHIGGVLQIESEPGKGTHVHLRVKTP